MGRRKEYFLVARNKNNNSHVIIKINGKRNLSLEDIDEFTLRFDNGSRMGDYLLKVGVITCSNCDFYIANQTNNQMNYLEIVYDSRERRTSLLKEVITSSKTRTLDKDSKPAKEILDSFSNKMSADGVFNEYIIDGKSKLPKKFVDYFVGSTEVNYRAKYRDGSWPIKTYSLLRNVVVEMNRYDNKTRQFFYSDESSRYNEEARRSLDPELLRETSKDYQEGQLDLFTYLEGLVSDEDKLLEVVTTFTNLPSTVITKNSKGQYCYRTRTFIGYEADDLNKLRTLLTKELAQIIYELVNARQSTSIFDDSDYDQELKFYKLKLISKLQEDKKVLDNAYNWCLVYNKYSERLKGDFYGRQYTKQESQ